MKFRFRDPQVLAKALMLGRQLEVLSPQAVERTSERRDLILACLEFALRLVKSASSGSEFELRLIEGSQKALQLLLRRLKRAPGGVKFGKMFRTEASAPFG